MRKETLLSIVFAIGIVATALWVADQSLESRFIVNAGQETDGNYSGVERPNTSTAKDSVANNGDASHDNYANLQGSASPTGISKCVVNGKTIYSNEGCPNGADGRNVAIYDSAGIVSPPKENLADLTAKREAAERAYTLQQQKVASMTPSNSTECAELNKRIESLDAMARQPLSGSMQDWIKDQRKAARDRQFAIRC